MATEVIDNLIQIVESPLDVRSVIKKITCNNHIDGFYVCNINEIIHRHEEWKAIMPRVQPHYAVKCNGNKVILEILAALGAGFDCASKGEIRNVVSLGVDPSRIIFANPTKKIDHLEYAAGAGVDKMTFDNEYELHKIKNIYPSAKLLIRIRCDDLSARFIFGEKFGCDHTTEAIVLLRIAFGLGLNVIGVCFHIGSDSKNWSTYQKAIAAARYVFDVAATVGFNFTMLDLGGGFSGERNESIKEIGHVINSALHRYFPDCSVKVISEPGRYYVNTAFTLASNIHSIKTVNQIDPETKKKNRIRMYYIDVSVYGAFLDSLLFQTTYPMKPLNNIDSSAKLFPTVIWGPTLDPYDKISEGAIMFPRMNVGEWVIFEDVGAYTMALACEFNGFSTPDMYSIVDEVGWSILTEKVPYPLPRERFTKGCT